MRSETGKNVVGILPSRGRKDKRRLGRDVPEDIHTHALARDKAMSGRLAAGECPLEFVAQVGEDFCQCLLQLCLGRPADLIGRLAEISAGNEINLFDHGAPVLLEKVD